MPRNHFAKTMFSPYFQSDHYKETTAGKQEEKIEKFLKNILKRILGKKNV